MRQMHLFLIFCFLISHFSLVYTNSCSTNECLNGGSCFQNGTNIRCDCLYTHFGSRCEKRNCNDLRYNPCENGGQCELMTPARDGHRFKCHCPLGYHGYTCGEKLPTACDPMPCGSHGACHLTNSISTYECKCHNGYTGAHCEQRDYCSDNPCLSHGQCTSLENGYECKCFHGWRGEQCQLDVDECQGEPCEHGTCVNQPGYYYCECPNNFYGKNCESKRESGCQTNPCLNAGHCLEGSYDGRNFKCACPAGFTGERCEVNIDDCIIGPQRINVCVNGGYCIDGVANYTCKCPPNFTGRNCEIDVDECSIFGSSLCHNGGTCVNDHGGYKCICIAGFEGLSCEHNIDDCIGNSCFEGSMCIDRIMKYDCMCAPGRMGQHCEYEDPCYGKNNPCKHGKCHRNDSNGNYTCTCDNGFEGRNCDQDIDECEIPDACFRGTCINTIGSFVCKCETGFTGNLCDTLINECEPNPCKNGATCLDDIGRFICVCMPEYTGLYCETRANVSGNVHCTLPCENGGLCRNSTYCECPPPFTGPFCGQPKPDPCLKSNCTNGASCMPTSDYESFTCQCSPGYTGNNCEIFASGCYQKPCHYGKCTSTDDEYYCKCDLGYTGANCNVNINDCAENPCLNNGFCVDGVNSFKCICPADTTGVLCETKIRKPCEVHACQNGAHCVEINNSYECRCKRGFAGRFCEIELDECLSVPCQNNGQCVDMVNGFKCHCQPGYTGIFCENDIDECKSVECKNGGNCVDGINSFKCICPRGYYGTYCEAYKDVDQFWRNDEVDKNDCEKFRCKEKANNGVCNEECNRFACNYDGGDCALKNGDPFGKCPTASYCARAFGDKKCDQICDNEECLFDGFDCHRGERCPHYEYCSQRYADGKCDKVCNVANCGWDGGDCALMPKQHDLLPGDLVLTLLVDEPTFRSMINNFLLNLSWDLRSTIKIQLDTDGHPMIYHWHSTSGQGNLVDVSGLNLTGFIGVSRGEKKARLSKFEHPDSHFGIMVYLQIDVGMCRESYTNFDCFTNVDSAAQYLGAANAKKELGDLGIPIHSAVAYKPTPAGPKSGFQYLFTTVLSVLFMTMAVSMMVLHSRKRKLTAKIWEPDPPSKDNGSMRGSHLILNNAGINRPLIDSTFSITSSDYYGDNKGYGKFSSSSSTTNGNTLEKKEPFDPKLTELHKQAGSHNCISILPTKEDVYTRDARGRTPLHWTVDSHKDKSEQMIIRDVDLLIAVGAEVSARDNDERTPLHLALRRARENVALRLLEHKAEILNMPDYEDRTPLYDAVCVQSAKVVCAILHLSNDDKMVNTVVGKNDTALKACTALTHEPAMPILRMLLEHKANPNLAGNDKDPFYEAKTPLHIAASVNNYTFIRPLIDAGANKDAQDVHGRTPLFLAAENGHVESCLELLRLGASKDVSDDLTVSKDLAFDYSPRTPQLVAAENGFAELAKKIETFVAEPDNYDTRVPSRLRASNDDDLVGVPAKRAKKSPKVLRPKQKEKEIGPLLTLTPPHSDKSSYSYTPSPQQLTHAMNAHPPPATNLINPQTNPTNSHLLDSGNAATSSSSCSPASHSPDNGYQSGSVGWSPHEEDLTLTNLVPQSHKPLKNASPQAGYEAPSMQNLHKRDYFKQLSPPYEPNNSQMNTGASTSTNFDPYTSFHDNSQPYGYSNEQLFYQNPGYFNPQFGANPQLAMFYNQLRKPDNPPTYNQYYSNPTS